MGRSELQGHTSLFFSTFIPKASVHTRLSISFCSYMIVKIVCYDQLLSHQTPSDNVIKKVPKAILFRLSKSYLWYRKNEFSDGLWRSTAAVTAATCGGYGEGNTWIGLGKIIECSIKAYLVETKFQTKVPCRDKFVTSGIRASRFKAMANETLTNGASGSTVVDKNCGRYDKRQDPKKTGSSKDVVASLDKRVTGVETTMTELKTQVEGLKDQEVTGEELEEEIFMTYQSIKDLQADVALCKRRRKRVVIRDSQETATTTSTIIHSEAKSKDKGKGILVEEPKPLKKQAQIEQDKKYARELEAEMNKNIDWDEVIDHVQRKQKEDKAVKIYQALKRKPQTEAKARKNMMIYLRNVAGFKMDYFKEMYYDDIRPIFEKKFNSNVAFLMKIKEQIDEEESRALKRLNETQEDKALKKQKLDENVEELKRHLQIVPNDEDDVYTEATPLALKVPVVDYEIYNENNKPYYKIKRADGSHQLYLSFLSLLRNFDIEDLEALCRLVKERFATTKPKNVSDDFLLITLGAMFEKPDIHA
nr:hypothetical protein [Tanacetum cinerariifolium]